MQGKETMFSHVMLGSNDLERARIFYDAVMGSLGLSCRKANEQWLLYDKPGAELVGICRPFDGKPATAGNGTMIAFSADDRATVDRFHAAALASGGSDEGKPGLRPHYHADYYGAYVRDPDGNKLCCVCRKPVGAGAEGGR
jgi:catechol 2,3-dioxygenase-like lactoylglutathione lyase family enzyme